ncbi:pyridoxal 5'-phosphate synthase glutaminase subunit PdxT [Saxibacter everestensis]|uniref:Pyridoxal 5'-phosphate synthase subunit PdxT n=1 Tax=Saxibacter everestensis TaxID=2909229 RepID=A0ABY8QV28_9MICO|nr:pyridoxal 5'-phosphate synthase glutaminase subunit PdxT [Brevibacteriaceae bacterium ZFBP1038]
MHAAAQAVDRPSPPQSARRRIGVLALQGDFREHLSALRSLGAEGVAIRREAELDGIDGLIIPGGESTTMGKIAAELGLLAPLRGAIDAGLPTYGTCAGMIMLADQIRDAVPGQQNIGGLDVIVRRNAFGSQLESFQEDLIVDGIEGSVPAVFIRAPVVEEFGADVTVLARLSDDRVVAVRQGNIIAMAFHPEISGDLRLHEAFLEVVNSISVEA